MLRRGATFGPYVIVGQVGEGRAAAVYRVRHQVLGSVHALKVNTFETDEAKVRLRLEGKRQASVRHPNVVSVTDVLDVGQRTALVMEYVKGSTLRVLLRTRVLTLDQALQLYASIVRGVQAVHDAGLVHRDLKPANVLLGSSGEGVLPKIGDFGLAIEQGQSIADERGPMGTPQYMAPEQLAQHSNIDARADLFALGCILYELVAGRPPFEGGNLVAVAAAVRTGQYSTPRLWAPDTPDVVVGVIDRLLRVDVGDRLPSCEQLLAMLYGSAEGEVGQPVRLGEVALRPSLASQEATVIRSPSTVQSVIPQPAPLLAMKRRAPVWRVPWSAVALASVVLGVVVLAGVVLLLWRTPAEPDPALQTAVDLPREVPAPTLSPEPEPAPPVVPVPAPGPVPAATGHFSVEGDAEVQLRDAQDVLVEAGALPAGTYRWEARFAASGRRTSGVVELRADQRVVLRCSSFAMRCITR
ncbi:MAG: serine/threonine protein kinase [Myxococcales bacterium]|nr:serine/threonine protein kinase [Myxococcales bacterium]